MEERKKVEVKIVGQTNIHGENSFEKNDAYEIAGAAASVCYDQNANSDIAKYLSESAISKQKRGQSMVNVGHGSPLEHFCISFVLKNVSKVQSIIMNNQRVYSLSERSFRYTMPDEMPVLYTKWFDIFTHIGIPKKKAQENARYMISMFNRNSLGYYTMNIRQINVLLRMLEDFFEDNSFLYDDNSVFEYLVYEEALDLYNALKVFDMKLKKSKYQKLNLYTTSFKADCIFDESYISNSKATPVALAQLQRHRTLSYSFSYNEQKGNEYYIPSFLNSELTKLWISDAENAYYPNCIIFDLKESGNIYDFMMKYDLRKGANVQEETRDNVNFVRDKLISLSKCESVSSDIRYALETNPDDYNSLNCRKNYFN